MHALLRVVCLTASGVVVVMSTAWGGGGGAGFGGFPYRSPHQQGNAPRRRPRRKPRRKPPALMCAADLYIPENLRGLLIGRRGTTIQLLATQCAAKIHVPKRGDRQDSSSQADVRPVRVKAESVASLLHASWRIRDVLGAEGDDIDCHIRIPLNAPSIHGRLRRSSPFLVEASGEKLVAYSVESFLDADEVDTLVDNERFANVNVTAHCEMVYQDDTPGQPTTVIFVYGSSEQQPERLTRALREATAKLWREQNSANITPIVVQDDQPPLTIAVGTYNLLYPDYAERYQEQAGLDRMGNGNWNLRAPAIVRMLLEHKLDIYLLQEVENTALQTMSEMLEPYQVIVCVHPGRSGDAVALLIRKDRFIIQKQEMVPFQLNTDPSQSYMCAVTALIKDSRCNMRYLVASTHFYTKKALHPQETLLAYLEKVECDAVIWGGDCNEVYENDSYPPGYATADTKDRVTRGHKHIDWIFCTPNLKCWRSAATEAFVQATMNRLDPSGYPPSDHYGEAVTLSPLSLSLRGS